MSDMLTGGQMLWKLEDCGDRVLHLRHNVSEESAILIMEN